MQGSEEAKSTTGYAYVIRWWSHWNAFPGRAWERVLKFCTDANRVSNYLPNPLPRELEGRQMHFSS
ncbi:hypothetical protein NIES4072_50720 [Nostoc commune NIES-4072]|uniref:Uncharacterized protein n=1 Tax=Nostoc commune NIES-4072 TaxID=2005467 RepID=A0A2R5FVA4_NOSCO|nr:hypothetical protein NIES4070_40230 [Nostoc commune HK-02]GBG21388.1 hypothetical protein NIES4072_50720 [Nostoc commune NIES-4072]